LVDIENRIFPASLMAQLRSHLFKSIIGNDPGSLEILKFSRIRAGMSCQPDQLLCPLKVTVVVGRYPQ
jgi:hypothetical protein